MQPDQLRKLTRKWAIPIIVVTILGAAASYLVSKRLTPMYAAMGKVLVVAGPGSPEVLERSASALPRRRPQRRHSSPSQLGSKR